MSNTRRDSSRNLPRAVGALLGMALVLLAVAVLAGIAALAEPATGPRPAAAVTSPDPGNRASGAPTATASAVDRAGSAGSSMPTESPGSHGGSFAPVSSSTPAPSGISSPTPSSGPTLDPPPAPGPFEMDLYRRGDFVTELVKVQCVPAAMQTMINIMSGTPDRTNATQDRLYSLARKLSPKTLKGPGAEPEGWAAALTKLGYGTFVVKVQPTMKAAIQAAAKAIRMTGRPAGLLVWYGAHSWVMSGFRATADPAYTDHFTVTAVYIEDVWYPKISTIWGASRPPDALVPVKRLPRDYLPWRMPGGPYPDKVWKYVQVLPTVAAP